MSVGTVITQGFGPSASIPFVITDGYSIGAATFSPNTFTVLSKTLGDLALSISVMGNILPLAVTTVAPSSAPPGGNGIVFQVSGGAVTIWVWDGASWISK